MSMFQKATRKRSRSRTVFSGPSGAGKTMWALVSATILAGGTVTHDGVKYRANIADGSIAFVDTEKGSASLYADQFNFDVLEIAAPYHPERLREVFREAAAAGYKAIVVDSLTHFWSGPGGVLEVVEAAGRGNSFSGWNTGKPVQFAFYQLVKDAPLHVICTARSKVNTVQEGRQVIKKGVKSVQSEDLVYEFDIAVELDLEHSAACEKTRFSELANRVFRGPDAAAFAAEMLAALNADAVETARPDQISTIMELADELQFDSATLEAGLRGAVGVSQVTFLTPEQADVVIGRLQAALAKKVAATKAAEAAELEKASQPAAGVAPVADPLGDYDANAPAA
ncbi:AAA family ATPase [uncultured Friedmanniella sp.]|uniref:AAA family ATPase n=1 Tax=uncultured Friedmanniella sp. TaxID=335381 RepID=UPI0035CB3B58